MNLKHILDKEEKNMNNTKATHFLKVSQKMSYGKISKSSEEREMIITLVEQNGLHILINY